jgi:hypothetical protein
VRAIAHFFFFFGFFFSFRMPVPFAIPLTPSRQVTLRREK